MKAICMLSIGWLAVAIGLPSRVWAVNPSVETVLVTASFAPGQADATDEAYRRSEADKWLQQARQAMASGQWDSADYCVQRAERLNAKYDSALARFGDTPEKVRRAIAAARGNGNPEAQPPSQRFTPNPVAAAGQQPPAGPRSPLAAPARENLLNALTDDAPAKARMYLKNARQALQQGDKTGAVVWYQRAVATKASFAKDEYSPHELAVEMQRVGIDMAQLAPPAEQFSVKPADFVASDEMQRLPPVTGAARADAVFEKSVISNPAQLGALPPANGNPQKSLALRLMAQAQSALERGDVWTAKDLAEQAQALHIPDQDFTQGEKRPWEVLLRVNSELNRRSDPRVAPASGFEAMPAIANDAGPQRGSVQPGLYMPEYDPTRNQFAQTVATPGTGLPPPQGSAGVEIYREGLRALEARDHDGALNLFREAWKYQAELDPVTRQELKDKLSLLAAAGNSTSAPEPSALDEVNAQQELLKQKLFREITNETKAAQMMIPQDPRGANDRVTHLRERVSQAEIDPAARKQLLTIVDRELALIQAYIKQNGGDIELQERNREILASIERDEAVKIEVQEKVVQLLDQYNELMDEERFAEAEVIAKQIRELDPDNPVSRLVTSKSKIARRLAQDVSLRDAAEEGFVGSLQDVDRAKVAEVGDLNPLSFGDITRWEQLKKNRGEMLALRERQLTPKELEIQEALKKTVDVRFTDRPLKEVLDTLGNIAGINIYADPLGLSAEGITSDTPITINLTQPISLRSALNLILEPLRLSYVVQNEVLRITSEQSRDSNVYQKVYNVADLVIPIPNFIPGYNVGLPSAIREAHSALGYGGIVQPVSMAPLTVAADDGQGQHATNPSVLAQSGAYGLLPKPGGSRPTQALGYGSGSMGGAALADFDTLIQLITSTISPDTWDEVGGPGAIEPFPTNLSLVISQTQDVHEQIADLLEQLRRLQDLQVAIEVRFITIQDNFFERIGVDFDFDVDDNVVALPSDDQGSSVSIGLDPDGTPTADFDFSFTQGSFSSATPQFGGFAATDAANFGFAILSDIEAFFLLQASQGDQRSNVLQAPKVTLFNGQAASVSDVSQRPFVTSLIPVVGDFAAAQQPVIVVLSEGTSLGVQAVVSSDRRFVRLTLVPFFSQIGEVDEFTFEGTTTSNTGTNVVDADGEPTGDVNNAQSTTQGTTVQLPTFSFTTVSTTVSVPDGGTVLLGGIKRLREGRNERGVPMLNKIPYVNRLFKNVGIGRETQSLMLMVTPRIIIQEEEEQNLGIELNP